MPGHDRAILRHPLSWRSWRFRLVLAMLLLITAIRLVWGWQAERMLKRQLDAARARGEPVVVADLHIESVPDSENAWTLQTRAMQALVNGTESPRYSNDDYANYPPYDDAWMKRAAASEKAHGPVFALARQARSLSNAQIRKELASPLLQSLINSSPATSVSGVRKLGCTLTDAAIYSHLRGDDVEAIERILDAMHVAESLRHDPVLISQLMAMRGIDSNAENAAQIIAPGLHLQPGAAARAATAKQVRLLIAKLLDEEAVWRGFEAGLSIERLTLDEFNSDNARGMWFIHPVEDREVFRTNRYIEAVIGALRLRNKPAMDAALSRTPMEKLDADQMAVLFGQKVMPRTPRYSRWFSLPEDLSMSITGLFREIAERRVTAVSQAAQLYRADHGAWPAKLGDLVPAYLPAVPVDPFHDDARALGYAVRKGALPGGADRPMVFYDAGPDRAVAVFAQPMYEWQSEHDNGISGRDLRQYRDLARFVPAPSTQAVDHDPQKSDRPRN